MVGKESPDNFQLSVAAETFTSDEFRRSDKLPSVLDFWQDSAVRKSHEFLQGRNWGMTVTVKKCPSHQEECWKLMGDPEHYVDDGLTLHSFLSTIRFEAEHDRLTELL